MNDLLEEWHGELCRGLDLMSKTFEPVTKSVIFQEVRIHMPEIAREVRTFVVDNFLFGEENELFSNQDSFLDKGLIDSMGILTLVEFVKDKYSIAIQDEELVPEHFDSVERISSFIQQKLSSRNN